MNPTEDRRRLDRGRKEDHDCMTMSFTFAKKFKKLELWPFWKHFSSFNPPPSGSVSVSLPQGVVPPCVPQVQSGSK